MAVSSLSAIVGAPSVLWSPGQVDDLNMAVSSLSAFVGVSSVLWSPVTPKLRLRDPSKNHNHGIAGLGKHSLHFGYKPRFISSNIKCGAAGLHNYSLCSKYKQPLTPIPQSYSASNFGVPRLGKRSLGSKYKQPLTADIQAHSASLVCAAALNVRCGAGQTQTLEKPASVISKSPIFSREKLPRLDDSGPGVPPHDRGGGGGGGGGGGKSSGGWFLFGFLLFLSFLKDEESEKNYRR